MCNSLITLLEVTDRGRWRPEKWSECEPVRSVFSPESRSSICSKWTQERGGRVSNEIFFRRQKPFAETWVSIWRGRVPSLNSVRLTFEANAFSNQHGVERLKSLILDFVQLSRAVYGTARHSDQANWRVAQGTPTDRLRNLDWLTFLGKPYIELFGGIERIVSAPWFSSQQSSLGVLLLADAEPNSRRMTESDQTLVALERYLGSDAFAGAEYPEVPCLVPNFDLSETVRGEATGSGGDPYVFGGGPFIITSPKTSKPTGVIVLGKQ
jgi:hypothetical protein